MSRIQQEFIVINTELDEKELREREFFDKLHLFATIYNPEKVSKFHKETIDALEIADGTKVVEKESIAEKVIEWTTMSDFWATFDLGNIIDQLEKLDG